jgi:hypothetical protein
MIWFVSGPSGCGKTHYVRRTLQKTKYFACSTEEETLLRIAQRQKCIVIDSLETFEDSTASLVRVLKRLVAYESSSPKTITVILVFEDLFDLPTDVTNLLRGCSRKKDVQTVTIPRPSKAMLASFVESAVKQKLNPVQEQIIGSFRTYSNLLLFLQTFGKDFVTISHDTVAVDTSIVPFEAIRQYWFEPKKNVCCNLDRSEVILWSWWNFLQNVNARNVAAKLKALKKDPLAYELYVCCKSSELLSFVDILPYEVSEYSYTCETLALAAPQFFVKKLALVREKTIVGRPESKFMYLPSKPKSKSNDSKSKDPISRDYNLAKFEF